MLKFGEGLLPYLFRDSCVYCNTQPLCVESWLFMTLISTRLAVISQIPKIHSKLLVYKSLQIWSSTKWLHVIWELLLIINPLNIICTSSLPNGDFFLFFFFYHTLAHGLGSVLVLSLKTWTQMWREAEQLLGSHNYKREARPCLVVKGEAKVKRQSSTLLKTNASLMLVGLK